MRLPIGVTRARITASIPWSAFALFAFVHGLSVVPSVSAQDRPSRFEEVRRFNTEEATQGVAVDESHFYWDPTDSDTLYSILRSSREVIVSNLR